MPVYLVSSRTITSGQWLCASLAEIGEPAGQCQIQDGQARLALLDQANAFAQDLALGLVATGRDQFCNEGFAFLTKVGTEHGSFQGNSPRHGSIDSSRQLLNAGVLGFHVQDHFQPSSRLVTVAKIFGRRLFGVYQTVRRTPVRLNS